jgi:hypothetical protein
MIARAITCHPAVELVRLVVDMCRKIWCPGVLDVDEAKLQTFVVGRVLDIVGYDLGGRVKRPAVIQWAKTA